MTRRGWPTSTEALTTPTALGRPVPDVTMRRVGTSTQRRRRTLTLDRACSGVAWCRHVLQGVVQLDLGVAEEASHRCPGWSGALGSARKRVLDFVDHLEPLTGR